MSNSDRVPAILTFWFGDPPGQKRKVWFQKQPAFDQTIRDRFLADYEAAAAGQLDSWRQQPQSALALVLLLDQFPRNLFRGSPRSFATDPQALALAQHLVAEGLDQALRPIERFFVYLPFEHSENLADQDRAVALFTDLVAEAPDLQDGLDYAIRHRDVIQQFGRFPHRNEILGRATTPAEAEFLQQPGSRF